MQQVLLLYILVNSSLKTYLEVDYQGALLAWNWILVLKVCQSAHGHGVPGTQ